jgi:hypothetical protein
MGRLGKLNAPSQETDLEVNFDGFFGNKKTE